MGHPLDRRACAALLNLHDKDHDGKLTAEEFAVAHAQLKALVTPTTVVPFTNLRVPRSLYLAVVIGVVAVLLCGIFLLAQRFQRCPCDLCTGVYVKTERIGSGAFGEVWFATGPGSGDEDGRYAIKCVPVTGVTAANRGVEEATQLARCRHRNLLQIKRQFFHSERVLFGSPYTFCIVTELCAEGDLREWACSRPSMQERECLLMAAQMIEGLQALHAAGVVHGDIKPENIFVNHDEHWHSTVYKIGDFGLAQAVDGIYYTQVGTPGYQAPEVIEASGDYDTKADVWSAGMVLLECICGFQGLFLGFFFSGVRIPVGG